MPESDYYESSHRREVAYSPDDGDRYKRTTVRRYKVGSGRVERIEKSDRSDLVEDLDRRPRDRDPRVPRRVYRDDRDDRFERDDRDDQIVVETYNEDRRTDGYGEEVEHWRKETEYYDTVPPAPAPIVIRSQPHLQKTVVHEGSAPAPRHNSSVLVIREKDRAARQVDHDHDYDRDHDRDHDRDRDDYYIERRERREVNPYRGDRVKEEEFAVGRLDRRPPHQHHHRHHSHDRRDYASDGDYASDDQNYYKHAIVSHRNSSPSPDPHRRLHLAEGALAGAGIGALVGSRRNADGELPEHRGRKVLAGAALGAMGTEILRRAQSAYNERFDDEDDRDRRRSSSRHHSKLKAGLGIAAAALAVAGAAKYIQSNRIEREEREERGRGRSRRRYSDSEDDEDSYRHTPSRTPSRPTQKSRSRAASIAKVAAGTAAVAGIAHHIRSKSRRRDGKSRSHSRLRTAAEIAAAGLVGVAAKKLYDKHQDKKDQELEEGGRELSEGADNGHHSSHSHSRPHPHSRTSSHSGSRSHSRSAPSAGHYPSDENVAPVGADRELGLVEYGNQPLYSDPPYPESSDYPSADYDSAIEDGGSLRAGRRHRRRDSRDRREVIRSDEDDDDDPQKGNENRDDHSNSRSRSRLRDLAAAGAGAAAAAIGIKSYEERKEKKARQGKSRDREEGASSRSRRPSHDYDRGSDRDTYGDVDRIAEGDVDRRYQHGIEGDGRNDANGVYDAGYYDYDDHRAPSPPHASGGAFYPVTPAVAGEIVQNTDAPFVNGTEHYPGYNPPPLASNSTFPPPPPGPPPATGAPSASPPVIPPKVPGVPVSVAPRGPGDSSNDGPIVNSEHQAQPPLQSSNHVSFALPTSQGVASALSKGRSLSEEPVKGTNTPSSKADKDTALKTVSFLPFSPKPSYTLRRQYEEMHHISDRSQLASSNKSQEGTSDISIVKSHGGDNTIQSASSKKRSLVLLKGPGQDSLSESSDEDGELEILPNRFDAEGRPLDRAKHPGSYMERGSARWTSRQGDFEFAPRRSGSSNDTWRMRGQWGVTGTDTGTVDRIAESMRGIINGFGTSHPASLMGLVGGVLEGLSRTRSGLEDAQPRVEIGGRSDYSRNSSTGRQYSSDDDRKRKRRNTYSGRSGSEGNYYSPENRHDRPRSSSVDSYDDHYHDQYGYSLISKKRRGRPYKQ